MGLIRSLRDRHRGQDFALEAGGFQCFARRAKGCSRVAQRKRASDEVEFQALYPWKASEALADLLLFDGTVHRRRAQPRTLRAAGRREQLGLETGRLESGAGRVERACRMREREGAGHEVEFQPLHARHSGQPLADHPLLVGAVHRRYAQLGLVRRHGVFSQWPARAGRGVVMRSQAASAIADSRNVM